MLADDASAIEARVRDRLADARRRARDPCLRSRFRRHGGVLRRYGVPPEQSANTIVVAARKEPGVACACVVLATCRLDVNHAVCDLLGVRKASFASADQTRELTGMMIGGVTPFGLPDDLPLYIDARVMSQATVVIGGGSRSMKIRLAPAGAPAASRSPRGRGACEHRRGGPGMTRMSAAAAHIVKADPAFRRIVDTSPAMDVRPEDGSAFESLLTAIVSQQLAGAAARTIHGRLIAMLGGRRSRPRTSSRRTRKRCAAAGLSANKLAAIIDLAAKFVDGTVPTHDLDGLSDDEIVARLVTVRGVGRWTAEMFLLFQLRTAGRLAGGRSRCPQRLGTHPRHGGAAAAQGAAPAR